MKTVADLRRLAVSRSLFPPTTLEDAIERMGFVQADPIRAPARAQDLTLRPRVRDYRAGDLEARYETLGIEEDVFINYGFVTKRLQRLMHPRASLSPTSANKRAKAILAFVRERGSVHPREVDAHFSHGTVTNYWGGSSSATTHLLEAMQYKGMVRVARRENGIRIYAAQQHADGPGTALERRANIDALVDVVVGLYAPVPTASLSFIVSRLRYAAPHWRGDLKAALQRAKKRFAQATVSGNTWYWPEEEQVGLKSEQAGLKTRLYDEGDRVYLLAPFDPVVWDRRRFELLWDWAYRFEAYTPAPKRKYGYYALPLLWRDRVIGWANLTMRDKAIEAEIGYVAGRAPRDREFRQALERELEAMRIFLTPRG